MRQHIVGSVEYWTVGPNVFATVHTRCSLRFLGLGCKGMVKFTLYIAKENVLHAYPVRESRKICNENGPIQLECACTECGNMTGVTDILAEEVQNLYSSQHIGKQLQGARPVYAMP